MGQDSPQACELSTESADIQNDTQVEYLDEFHRGRLRSLQAVDELVEEVVRKLEAAGELDNTYIFYTCAFPS